MSMCAVADPETIPVVEASREEGIALFDRAARETLSMSGHEFLRRWDCGEWADEEDPEVMSVAMLVGFARVNTPPGCRSFPYSTTPKPGVRDAREDHSDLGGYAEPGPIHTLSLNDGQSVALKGKKALLFRMRVYYKIILIDKSNQLLWRVVTCGYMYSVALADGQAVFP